MQVNDGSLGPLGILALLAAVARCTFTRGQGAALRDQPRRRRLPRRQRRHSHGVTARVRDLTPHFAPAAATTAAVMLLLLQSFVASKSTRVLN